jgi:cell division septum initiation protein DivIVA
MPLTLLPIASILGGGTAAAASTEYIRVYLAIAVSAYINIVYKRVTDIVKDIQAIDRQLNEFKNSLSEIKDKLAFLRYSVIAFIHNARLLNIK